MVRPSDDAESGGFPLEIACWDEQKAQQRCSHMASGMMTTAPGDGLLHSLSGLVGCLVAIKAEQHHIMAARNTESNSFQSSIGSESLLHSFSIHVDCVKSIYTSSLDMEVSFTCDGSSCAQGSCAGSRLAPPARCKWIRARQQGHGDHEAACPKDQHRRGKKRAQIHLLCTIEMLMFHDPDFLSRLSRL